MKNTSKKKRRKKRGGGGRERRIKKQRLWVRMLQLKTTVKIQINQPQMSGKDLSYDENPVDGV